MRTIYLDVSVRKLAGLKLDFDAFLKTLQAQNAIVPSGVIQAGAEQVSVRVGGQFVSEESLKSVNLRIGDQFFRLSDVAEIHRGYVDPFQPLFRYNGEPAIGLAIAMRKGGNILHVGEALKAKMRAVTATLPIGVGIHLVSDQPRVVEEAVGGFTEALFEAIVIVLRCQLRQPRHAGRLGRFDHNPAGPRHRASLSMQIWGISLQRISLGRAHHSARPSRRRCHDHRRNDDFPARAGDNLKDAASTFAYTSTAFPMLTGTLVTVAGFIPIGLLWKSGWRVYLQPFRGDRVRAFNFCGSWRLYSLL